MSTTTATAEADPFAILGDALETAADSLETASTDARASAHRASAGTKRVIGSGAYSISYGLAYGAVFTATYLHDLMPIGSAVQRGFADGAHDALEARKRRMMLRQPHEDGHGADLHEAHAHCAEDERPAAATKTAKRATISRKTRQAVDKRAYGFEK
ncbi:MAG: hypothetical protein JOY66_03550, partial [Acetobacteraceae bacterium]|nr:hypothetical protein [Acetobacteraceae bacterium]